MRLVSNLIRCFFHTVFHRLSVRQMCHEVIMFSIVTEGSNCSHTQKNIIFKVKHNQSFDFHLKLAGLAMLTYRQETSRAVFVWIHFSLAFTPRSVSLGQVQSSVALFALMDSTYLTLAVIIGFKGKSTSSVVIERERFRWGVCWVVSGT